MWLPGSGLPQLACSGWFKRKNAELFPAMSNCVLWISNNLKRVAAGLGNYMLSDATFVPSAWHFGCNWDTKTKHKTKHWQRVGQTGRSGSCQLHFDNVSWQCLLACWRFNLCFNKQQIFGRFPCKQTWPAVECCSSSAVDLQFYWSVQRSGAFWLITATLLSESNRGTEERTEEKTARLLHPSQVAYIWGRSSLRGTRPSTYATQTVVMSRWFRSCFNALFVLCLARSCGICARVQ